MAAGVRAELEQCHCIVVKDLQTLRGIEREQEERTAGGRQLTENRQKHTKRRNLHFHR